MAICCFAGHNQHYGNEIKNKIYNVCENLILNYDVNEFWVGNYGEFDKISASIIRSLKQIYPYIKLNLVIPYITSSINIHKDWYCANFNNVIIANMPINTPAKLKIIKTNEYMVDSSNFIICFVNHSQGGAAITLRYANNKEHIKIINLSC